jgi:hypothetical protein
LLTGPFGYEARCKGCARWYYIEYYYGITRREFEWLLECQGGGCALCGGSETNPRTPWLSVDHDHSCCGESRACSKCIRGLLCDRCNNRLLPLVEASPMLRARFQDYLDSRPFLDQTAPLNRLPRCRLPDSCDPSGVFAASMRTRPAHDRMLSVKELAA